MTEQEQIEEMAYILDGHCDEMPICEEACSKCRAKKLYAAGYRKQVEGEWETFPSIGSQYRCSVCKKKNERKSVFCPNCGAKMKGGAEQ